MRLFTYHTRGRPSFFYFYFTKMELNMATTWLPTYNERIDGTTEFLLAGVLPYVVKAMGRWSLDSRHRYWCSPDEIILNHLWNLPATSCNYK